MGLYSTFKSSYQQKGIFDTNMPYHHDGFKAGFRAANPGMARPAEGFGHAIKRGIADNFLEAGYSGTGVLPQGLQGNSLKYGGSIFTRGGLREVTNEVQALGASGKYMMGARRSTMGMIGKAAGKLITPALFAYTAATEGLGQATKDTVEQGAIFGAARWAWGRGVAALGSPMLLGAMAVAGAAVGTQKALQFGFNYNQQMKKSGFVSPFNDVYGNAATMRQASLMAIQSSKINGRNALGQEASLVHMR